MAPTSPLPPWPHRVDGGIVLLVAALFLVSVLAHRYWRAKIRLEDDLEAKDREASRAFDRYFRAFRALPEPAAFVDRNSALVMEATPGWTREGLPAPGDVLHAGDPSLEEAWRAIPAPGPAHEPAAPVALALGDRAFTATCLGGDSLGVVLLTRSEGQKTGFPR
jgi:hypothetical protein